MTEPEYMTYATCQFIEELVLHITLLITHHSTKIPVSSIMALP